MKKLMLVLMAMVGVVAAGCKSVPSAEKMETVSAAIGCSAGLVLDLTKIDEDSRETVIEVINEVARCAPAEGQTFEDAWMPIAKEKIDELVQRGKIDAGEGVIVLAATRVACLGIDYIFEVRYPKAKQYKELVFAAINGFSGGFLSVFKPVNMLKSANDAERIVYDKEAYEYLKEKVGK